jgi:uncharacterized repeat protein (TIGR03803 family)
MSDQETLNKNKKRRSIMKSKALTCMTAMGLLGFAFVLLATLAVASATADETVLHNFNPYANGANPQANLYLGLDGKFYGTTSNGGASGAGVVFKTDQRGHETVLYSFAGGTDGANPYANVIQDRAGNLYGTTSLGGADGAGVVFKVDTRGRETVLHTFTGGADGGYSYAGLIEDRAGNLYGTASGGGAAGAGVVFKLDSRGHYTVLYTFTGGADGGYSYAGLIQDPQGNLYGTTSGGGADGSGVVFKLDRRGNETVLYSFTGNADGGYPYASVIQDWVGNLYGTTSGGGAAGAGVVFKLDRRGQETVLYSFTGGADGGYPYAGVIEDWAGNLYGTTSGGGSAGAGVTFKVDQRGNETVLHSFTNGADGGYPLLAGLIMDFAGNLYGDTPYGGTIGAGVLFKIDPAGHQTVMYSFPVTDGIDPLSGVIQDSTGNLYGTTTGGGPANAGVVYKLDATGRETLLYSFTGGTDGANPQAGLIQDSAGYFYGTTESGGAAGAGVVFKLDGMGHETVLYSFTGGTDGAYPLAGLIQDSAGNFYGTTVGGGSGGKGVVFKLDPMGHEAVLHNFTGPDGAGPYSGVTFDSAGNLYGTTVGGGTRGGVVYKLDPAGNYTVLHDFTYGPDGGFPWGGVTLDSAGNLYGTTWSGGPPSGDYPGVVYKVDSAGNFSVLYTFTGFTDGGGSRSNVVFDSAGNLYGTTQYGGQGPCFYFGCGVVFELNPTGHQTVLYSFSGGADGSEPGTGLIRDATGNFYGTTSYGGVAGSGVVYKLTPGGDSPEVKQPVQRSFSPRDLRFGHPLPGEPPRTKETTGASGCLSRVPGVFDRACG